MPREIGFLMDPIEGINPKKDSTLAMMLAAQARGYALSYFTPRELFVRDGIAYAQTTELQVFDDPKRFFEAGESRERALHELDVLLMRKDPPFDMEYIYATYVLELAERQGLLVANRPQGLRDFNEKVAALWFPNCIPATLVTKNAARIRTFVAEQGIAVLKPLDGMGGSSIFRVDHGDPNLSALIEVMTEHQRRTVMVQRFIPEIAAGDKRILLIDGEPMPTALARVPAAGEFRGNLAAGATGHGQALSERDYWICRQVGPLLRERGMLFVGLDVIGDYLTEVNVTSPTGIREIDRFGSHDSAGALIDALERRISASESHFAPGVPHKAR